MLLAYRVHRAGSVRGILMPDLRTERRLRQRYNFDVPVKFRVDAGGTRDETFRYVPNFVRVHELVPARR